MAGTTTSGGGLRDVAVVSYASVAHSHVEESETQMLFPVVADAIERSGIARKEIGFTCSGSADYLTGGSFAFVSLLEVTGAWPPISESHVEMDGAWALYEAWVRLQHGDVDTALVYASGMSSRCDLREVLALQADPYYLAPLGFDNVSAAALQARAYLDASGRTESDMAAVAARSRAAANSNPNAQVRGTDGASVLAAVSTGRSSTTVLHVGGTDGGDSLLQDPYVVAPLRAHDCPPISDGAAAVVLAVGDKAREVCERPAWIRGIAHRIEPHYPGVRDLSRSESARLAGIAAGVGNADVEVAELSAAFSHEELMLRDALGLDDRVEVNPSGGALASNPMMATGLVRIGEAFRQVNEGGRRRVLAHAASGPCLQQNLVCVLEGD